MFTKTKSNGAKPPSGLQMMLKAMGIEFDPETFSQVGQAVIDVRDRLQRIEEKLDRMLGESDGGRRKENHGQGGEDGTGNSGGSGSEKEGSNQAS